MNDLDTLARTLYGEAVAYDVEDASAIACVIMNRVGYKNWPNSVAKVCLQPWQFSCWNQNDPNRERILNASGDWFDRCKEIAQKAIDGDLVDETLRSTHYHTPNVKPSWSRGKKAVFKSHGHLFFNDIDTPAPQTAKDALDQQKPLNKSRTVQGSRIAGGAGAVATVAGIASEISPALPVLNWVRDNLSFALIVLGVAVLAGVGYAVYARLDDRKKGLR